MERQTIAPLVAVLLAFSMIFSVNSAHAQTFANTTSTEITHRIFLPLAARPLATMASSSLQAAVNAARPGDTITLNSTSYTGGLVLRSAGTSTAPITLAGAGAGRTILRGTLRIIGDARFWRIQDLELDATGTTDGVRIEAPAHDITVQHVHLHGGTGYGVRVGNDVSNVLVEASEIDHFDAGTSDAHGVGIMTASNVTVRGCDIHHNSGDAVQSNTADYPGYNRFASNILVENNTLHENRENALDIKSTHGLTMRNNRAWGFRAVSSSDGMAIQVQYDAQDITITGNQVWDAVEAIEVTTGKKNGVMYPASPQRVTIAGNLFHDIVTDSNGDTANGSAIVVRTSSDVKVYNNTVLRAGNAALYLSYSSENAFPVRVDARNNVLQGSTNDLRLSAAGSRFPGLIVDYNHYANRRVNNADIAGWLLQGYEKHATMGNPQLDAASRPLAGSALVDSGVNIGLPFTGARPDRGWGELAP